VRSVWNFIAHVKLLANHAPAFATLRQVILKPSNKLAGAIERVKGVRIIETKIHFHHFSHSLFNPFVSMAVQLTPGNWQFALFIFKEKV
jgi:hypothetical protein